MSQNSIDNSSLGASLLRIFIAVAIVALVALAWFVATEMPYKAKSTLGHNMGWVGAGMMCIMLSYSLRKRFRIFAKLGQLKYWFQMHMTFGILGPTLALFHSTFHIGAMNSRVALYAMLMVAGSGIVGRFVYRHIHHGLYGRKATVEEFEQQMREGAENVNGVLGQVPSIMDKLTEFQAFALRKVEGGMAHTWRFMNMRRWGRKVAREARREARFALERAAREQGWSKGELKYQQGRVTDQINGYVGAVCSAATFVTWERMFALWHVVHVPFIYLFFGAMVVHVVAFYMF